MAVIEGQVSAAYATQCRLPRPIASEQDCHPWTHAQVDLREHLAPAEPETAPADFEPGRHQRQYVSDQRPHASPPQLLRPMLIELFDTEPEPVSVNDAEMA